MGAGFAPLETVETLLADVGLTPRGRFVPVDAMPRLTGNVRH